MKYQPISNLPTYLPTYLMHLDKGDDKNETRMC